MQLAPHPVKAILVEDIMANKTPGAFEYYTNYSQTEVMGMHFWCPCGCGVLLGVNFLAGYGWTWNKNRESPTVNPSIRHMNGCQWHGWLKEGVFTTC